MAYSMYGGSTQLGASMGTTTRGPTITRQVFNWKTMNEEELKKVASGKTRWGTGGFSTGAQRELDSRKAAADKATQKATYESLMQTAMKERESAKTANLERYQQGMDIFTQIEGMYSPGGAMETAGKAQIERTKKQDLAKAMQAAVSSGMGKTTRAAFSGARWEAEVGQQARLNLESTLQEKRAGAMAQKAGFIERRTDKGPDFSTIANLAMKAG